MNNKNHPLKYRQYLLDINDFKIEKPISSGGFGTVFSVKKLETNEIYAAKVITAQKDESKYKKMISREIGIMIRCQHSTIVRFYGYSLKDFYNQNNVTIFMEFLKKDSLASLLQKIKNRIPDAIINNTIRQIILIGIAGGMMYLHQQQIIHRDLKPDNVLLDEYFHPHLTDFGLSKLVDNFVLSQSQQCGTCIYMAPEVLECTRYNGKIDVYSFGILMYQVVTGKEPYPELATGKLNPLNFIHKVLNEDYRPTFSVPVKNKIKKLIESCWSKNPSERPTFECIFKKLAYGCEYTIEGIYDEQKQKDMNKDEEYEEEEDNCESDDSPYFLEGVDTDEIASYVNDLDLFNYLNDFLSLKEIVEKDFRRIHDENRNLKEKVNQLEQKLDKQEKSSEAIIEEQRKEIENLQTIVKKCQQDIQEILEKNNQTQQKDSLDSHQKDSSAFQQKDSSTFQQNDSLAFQQNNSSVPKQDQSMHLEIPVQPLASSIPPPPPPPPPLGSTQNSELKIPPNMKVNYFSYDNNPDHRLQGIIFHLTNECGGNVADNGVVDVSASSYSPLNVPKFAVDFSSSRMFQSKKESNQWLKYDFKKRKVCPTSYTIKTRTDGFGTDNPTSWVIEVSDADDGNDWLVIDERNEKLKSNSTEMFEIDQSLILNRCFRYIRLRQITYQRSSKLTLDSLEYFGYLYQ